MLTREARQAVQKMRAEHDPIEQVKQRLMANKWADEAELKNIDKDIRAQVSQAAGRCEDSIRAGAKREEITQCLDDLLGRLTLSAAG